MLQKLSIGLIFTLLVTLGPLVGNSSKISIPYGLPTEGEALTLHGIAIAKGNEASYSVGNKRQPDLTPTPEGTVTALSDSTLYLPVIMRNFCFNSFSYNETIRDFYNLEKVNAQKVWDCYSGSNIVVAIVDSGVDLDHPDLQANIVTGQTFVAGTSNPDDDYGHGSHVAGIVAGVGNNGGIIGVAPRAKIMPIKVLDAQGIGSSYNVANGIRWAVDHGARVINMSLAGTGNFLTVRDAVNYAYNKGALLVAAGGNCGSQASYRLNGCEYLDQPVYPGALPNVIAVASTDINDSQSSFSNEGSYIDVAAPGSDIYSTYMEGGYEMESGTSQATPHVSGLAALIWSRNTGLTNAQVRAQILNTVVDLGVGGWDSQFGYGRINAISALDLLQTTPVTDDLSSEETTIPNERAPFTPGEILFKPRTGLAASDILDGADSSEVRVTDQIAELGVQKLAVPIGQEKEWLAKLIDSGDVEYAELNYIVTIQ